MEPTVCYYHPFCTQDLGGGGGGKRGGGGWGGGGGGQRKMPPTLRHSDSASSFKTAPKTHVFNNYSI